MIINYNLFKKVLTTNCAFALSRKFELDGHELGERLFSKDFLEIVGAQEFVVAIGCFMVRLIKDTHADLYSVFITACKGCWYVFLGNIALNILIDIFTTITAVTSDMASNIKDKRLPEIAQHLESLGISLTKYDLYGADVSKPKFKLQREKHKRPRILITRKMKVKNMTFVQEHIMGSRKYQIYREGYTEYVPEKVKKLS